MDYISSVTQKIPLVTGNFQYGEFLGRGDNMQGARLCLKCAYLDKSRPPGRLFCAVGRELFYVDFGLAGHAQAQNMVAVLTRLKH